MRGTTTATGGLVYGVRLRREVEYRYVGITTKTTSRRFHQHLRVAAEGRKTPFYDWVRKHDPADLIADELDWLEGLDQLGQAEMDWIAYLRGGQGGDRLLNLSEGGLGPTGVVWTEEMREAARLRSTGRKGLSRFGEENPFFGSSHSLEQRQKWTRDRKGTFAGGENPNYGKFGPDHPGSDTPCLKRREQPYRMPGKARATQTSGSRLVPKPVQKCQQPERADRC